MLGGRGGAPSEAGGGQLQSASSTLQIAPMDYGFDDIPIQGHRREYLLISLGLVR